MPLGPPPPPAPPTPAPPPPNPNPAPGGPRGPGGPGGPGSQLQFNKEALVVEQMPAEKTEEVAGPSESLNPYRELTEQQRCKKTANRHVEKSSGQVYSKSLHRLSWAQSRLGFIYKLGNSFSKSYLNYAGKNIFNCIRNERDPNGKTTLPGGPPITVSSSFDLIKDASVTDAVPAQLDSMVSFFTLPFHLISCCASNSFGASLSSILQGIPITCHSFVSISS